MVITVYELRVVPFVKRSPDERIQIVLDGKPRPVNPCPARSCGSSETQNFDVGVYDRIPWLTACDRTFNYFCWPCLLFSNTNPLWGVSCSSSVRPLMVEEHASLNSHVLSAMSLEKFEKESASKARSKLADGRYRQVYQKNQDVMKVLIDVVCEMAKMAPLLKVCETQNRINADSCVKLLQLMGTSCGRSGKLASDAIDWVKSHPKLLDDVVEAIKKVLEMRLKKEMELSTFVSLILSEHSTESTCSQLSLVARYIKNGKVYERLLGFLSILVKKTAEVIYKILIAMVERFGISSKFLSCSLDGAILDTYELTEFKKMLTLTYPNFFLVPCYSHGLYHILQQCMSAHKDVGHFFKILFAMETFFEKKSKHWLGFQSLLLRKVTLPNDCENWQDAPLVTLVRRFRMHFIEYLESVSQNCNMWSPEDVATAVGLQQFLTQFQTVFLLHVVSGMFQEFAFTFIDEVIKSPDPELSFDKMSEVSVHLFVKPDFEDYWLSALGEFDEGSKERHLSQKDNFIQIFDDITARFYEEIRVRFVSLRKLEFCCLLLKDYCASTNQATSKVPKSLAMYYTLLQKGQLNLIDVDQLKNEMHVMRGRAVQMLDDKDSYAVLEIVSDASYRKIFTQFLKLVEFTLTMPFKRPPAEADALKLERIKKLQVASMILPGEISVLIIESDLIQNLRNDDIFFYRDVTSQFYELNKYIELMDERV